MFICFVFFFCIVGYLLFKDFCLQCCDEPVPQIEFLEEVSAVYPLPMLYWLLAERWELPTKNILTHIEIGPHHSLHVVLLRTKLKYPFAAKGKLWALFFMNMTHISWYTAVFVKMGGGGVG